MISKVQSGAGKLFAAVVGGLVLAGGLGSALAEDKYPSRPIEFIVPWGPGGGADQLARKIAPMVEGQLKVSLPVVNAPGATGQTGLTKMLTAPADGYAISVFIADTLAVQTTPGVKWSLDDVVPVGVMIQQPSAFFVNSGGPFKTWADVEAEAKKRPLKVAVTGFGSADDLTVNYFVKKGLQMVSVPFPKPGERYTAVLGGHADLLYEQLGDVRSFLDNKQMHPVITFAEKRFPAFKDVPTGKELGHEIMLSQFRSIVVRKGTDPKQVEVLSSALAKAAATDDYKAWLAEQYAEADSFVSAKDAAGFFKRELGTMQKFAITK